MTAPAPMAAVVPRTSSAKGFLLFDIFVRLAWRDSSIEGGKEI